MNKPTDAVISAVYSELAASGLLQREDGTVVHRHEVAAQMWATYLTWEMNRVRTMRGLIQLRAEAVRRNVTGIASIKNHASPEETYNYKMEELGNSVYGNGHDFYLVQQGQVVGADPESEVQLAADLEDLGYVSFRLFELPGGLGYALKRGGGYVASNTEGWVVLIVQDQLERYPVQGVDNE